MNVHGRPVPSLSQAADRAQLGAFVAVHPGLSDLVKVSLGGMVLGAALMSFLVLQPYAGKEYADDPIMGIVLPAAGAFFLVVGFVGFLVTRGRVVQLHAHGLVYKERGSIRPIRYADVIAVTQNITEVRSNTGTSFKGELVAHSMDGSRIRISPNIEGLDAVVSALVTGSAPSVIRHVVGALQAGKTVPGGPLTLTPQGVQHKDRLIPYASITSVDERSDMSFFMNKTTIVLEIRTREGGDPVKVPAGSFLYRGYLEAIADAMTPKAPKRPTVAIDFEVLQAHDAIDQLVAQAIRPLMQPHWGSAVCEVAWNAQGQLAPLMVSDPTTGSHVAASHDLHAAAHQTMAFHHQHRTEANRIVFALHATPGGAWSVETEFGRA